MQLRFQKTALVPAFRELRARDIYASTQKLACCQTCAHGDLSQSHSSHSLFFHSQDRAASRRPRRSSLVRRGLLHQRNGRTKGSVGFRHVYDKVERYRTPTSFSASRPNCIKLAPLWSYPCATLPAEDKCRSRPPSQSLSSGSASTGLSSSRTVPEMSLSWPTPSDLPAGREGQHGLLP